MYRNFTLILFFIISVVFEVYSQITPGDALVQMGRGINLGNTLEPPYEGGWNNGVAQEYYFDAYERAGFKTVRIPVRWDEHTMTGSPYHVNDTWMDRVEEVVDWALKRNLFVIINAHHEQWLKDNYADPAIRARFDSIWVQIAERFKDKSDSLFFEIINEPKGLTQTQIDDLNERILGIIRKTNPTRIVIYSGNEWSNSDQLMAAKIPDDDYIMGYFHSYNPWSFAGQGEGTWGTEADKNAIRDKFKTVGDWAKQNDLAIMISEFGAVNTCDYNSRMRHYAFYVESSMINNIPFMSWDDGGEFSVYQRNDDAWNEIKDILIHFYPESPTDVTLSGGERYVFINWQNRANYSKLIIERGYTATTLDTIAEISPGAENFTDTLEHGGSDYYYRLKAELTDGEVVYSYPERIYVTTAIKKNTVSDIRIFPNPVTGSELNLRSGSFRVGEEYNYSIYSITGQMLFANRAVANSSVLKIDLPDTSLKPGIYFLQVKGADAKTLSLKFYVK